MKTCTRVMGLHRCVAAVLSALLMSGCITISEPLEEPSPIPLLVTPTSNMQPITPAAPTGAELDQTVKVAGATGVEKQGDEALAKSANISPTATPEPIIYTVESGDTLSVVAKRHEITTAALMAANNLSDADELQIGQKLVIPSASQILESVAQSGTPIPTPKTENGDILHYVKEGETLSAIAAKYEVEKEDVLLANGLRPDSQLTAGDSIVVPQGDYTPVPTATPVPATPVPTLAIAQEGAEGEEGASEGGTPTPQPTSTPSVYTVKSGDVAGVIARDHGISLDALTAANPDANMERLSIGQKLRIPSSSNSEAGVTAAAAAAAKPETLAATPTPTVTPLPVATATPAPAYMAPTPLLPADGSAWVYRQGETPPQLLWTSTGILKENEYYVVRLRAVSPRGDVLWSESHWTQSPNWRLSQELMQTIPGRARLRWDVMVMRRTSSPDEASPTGISLSNKSPTFEINVSSRTD